MGSGLLGRFQTLHRGDSDGLAKWVGPDDVQETNFHALGLGEHAYPPHAEVLRPN